MTDENNNNNTFYL